jgi:hypothetical protein
MQFAKAGIAIAVCSAAAAGCVNARDEYNDFSDRLIDASGTGIDAPVVSSLPDVNGQWLVKAKPPVEGEFYFYFTTTITFTPVTTNTGRLAWQPQPHDFQTFENVGELLDAQEGDVDETASVALGMTGVLPGRANSLTQATVNLNGSLMAHLMSTDFICGEITGVAGTFPLQGSTFAAARYPGGDLVADFALSVPAECP